MTRLDAANVIRIFDFYLAAAFVLSLSRRYAVYWDTLTLLVRFRGRWPRLVSRLKDHHGVFVTGDVLRPLALAAALTVTQMLLSRVVFHDARLTAGEVASTWWMLALLLTALLPMLAVDTYFLVRVAGFDRRTAEESLDQAEHWLSSWKAPLVRAVTLGYVDPRGMVDAELKKSLEWLGQSTRRTAWWVALQVTCRVVCGATIWGLWLLNRTLS